MKRIIISFGWLVAAGVAIAGTGASNEFRLDCRTGVRTAAATEKIQYSTAWATNLTAAQQGEAKAVVKVNPCLKTPPKYLVVDMSGGRSAARWPVSYLDEVPEGGWTDEYKTEKLVLRYIPAGSFIMGGRATDYPGAINANLHMVTLTRPFYIGVFECTQRQWELAMGTRPSRFSNEACYATRPVERVSHSDIRGAVLGLQDPRWLRVDPGSFLGVLREKVGFAAFDLPTEAQWEFACRAGTTTALNSGKDIPSLEENDALNEVSRNCFNGGWIIDGEPIADDEQLKPYFSATDEFMTSRVGAYRGNDFGLYDMHGNVWEFVLDNVGCADSVDPLGWDESSATVGYCGGSFEQTWVGPYVSSSAGFLGEYDSTTSAVDRRHRNVGFRICLHNADFPILESAEVLVNASGASAVDWVPTQAGTYQLTHEVQMDGTTVAPMESALFAIEGPELEIVPMGELTNGVLVKVESVEKVEGVENDWPIYYTTDGTTPTAGSTKYEGPFALEASATVKAVAISAGGVSSEVVSKELALHPALAVEDVAARQRYPWNGNVDIDCEITGDATKKYAVTFSVEDEVGHTNLPIRTVTPEDRVLPPGKYRFTWDAAADLPKGTRFGGVSVSIDAEEWIVQNLRVVSPRAVNSKLELAWDGLAGAVAYAVFRKDGDKELVKIGESNENRFSDDALDETMLCQYGVAGVSESGLQGPVCPLVSVLRKSTVIADGLEAYYPFDEDGDDYSGHGRDFEKEEDELVATMWIDDTAIHFPVDDWCEDRIGRKKWAFSFRGTNHLHSVGGWGVSNNLSIACWIKARKPIVIPTTSEKATYAIFPVHGGDDDVNGIGFAAGTDGLAVCEHHGQYLKPCLVYDCALGEMWHHVAVTVADNGSPKLYLDGMLVGTGTNTGYKKKIGNGCTVGGGAYGSFEGALDDVRFYSRALSADEIFWLYNWFGEKSDPVPPSTTYRVCFHANGGSGEMADEFFEVGVAKALTANAFTRDGYAFEGWATSAGGAKVYEDQQSVSDLTTPGATVNLYAVWKQLGGVQLWANGPYWAECNVGATKPEEYGYYFWWGDTVGYKRNGSKWDAADGSKTGFSFTQENCPTEGMDNAQLRAAGYVDWNGQDGYYDGGNLVAAHDAATVHLGAPWRMPTADEISTLVYDCDWEWTKVNGVFGRKVKGRGTYASKQIFLPAAGYGSGSNIASSFLNNSKCGQYWSSTAAWDYKPGYSLHLFFDSFGINEAYDDSGRLAGRWDLDLRYGGCTIRPVR